MLLCKGKHYRIYWKNLCSDVSGRGGSYLWAKTNDSLCNKAKLLGITPTMLTFGALKTYWNHFSSVQSENCRAIHLFTATECQLIAANFADVYSWVFATFWLPLLTFIQGSWPFLRNFKKWELLLRIVLNLKPSLNDVSIFIWLFGLSNYCGLSRPIRNDFL